MSGDPRISELLIKRKSTRAFLPSPLTEEEISSLFEAARWSPSCGNSQPWHFVAVRSAGARDRLHEALHRGNIWAVKAPLLIAAAAREEDDKSEGSRKYFLFDLGMAVLSLLLQATEMGLVAHPMAGFDEEKAREALAVPEEYVIMTLIAVGRPGTPEDLDAEIRERDQKPRTRKTLQEFVHFDRW